MSTDERAEVIAIEILLTAIRQVRRLCCDPGQPARVILDTAYRDAERLLERHGVQRREGGVW